MGRGCGGGVVAGAGLVPVDLSRYVEALIRVLDLHLSWLVNLS